MARTAVTRTGLVLGPCLALGLTGLAGPAFAFADVTAAGVDWELRAYSSGVASYGQLDTPPGAGDQSETLFGHKTQVQLRGRRVFQNGVQLDLRTTLVANRDGAQPADDLYDDDVVDEVYLQLRTALATVQVGMNDGAGDQAIASAPNVFEEVTISSMDLDPFERQVETLADYNANGAARANAPMRVDTSPDFSDDNPKLYVRSPNILGFEVSLSYTPIYLRNNRGQVFPSGQRADRFGDNYSEVAAKFDAPIPVPGVGRVGVELTGSYGQGNRGRAQENPSEWAVGGSVEVKDWTLGAAYKRADVTGFTAAKDAEHFDVGVTYEFNDQWTAGVSYGQARGWLDQPAVLIGTGATTSALRQRALVGGVNYEIDDRFAVGIGAMYFRDRSDSVFTDGSGVDDRAGAIEGVAVFTEVNISLR